MGGWGGGIGIKAKLRPAGAGAWPELGKRKCVCEEPENMEHIYCCKKLNTTDISTEYENIYKGKFKEYENDTKQI